MDKELQRAVYIQHIDPDHLDDYTRAHNDVPDGVTDAMERAGIERFQLFIRDTIAVCIVEAPDIKKYNEVMATDPAVQQWEQRVADYKTDGVDVDAEQDDQIPYMDELWSVTPSEE